MQRVVALDAKEQDVARAHERCLQQRQTAKEQVTAQVDLVQAHGDELVDELIVDRHLHHGRQHDRANPERQNRVERRHSRTVIANRIDRLAVECDGAGKRRGQTLGVVADHRLDRGQIVRHKGTVKLVLKRADLVRCLTQLIGSLVDQPCGLREALCQRTRCVGQAVYGAIQVARDAVQRIQNARNGLLELLGLNRKRGIVVGLGARDTSLGIRDCLIDLGTRLVNFCHAVRKGLCGCRQVLGVIAILHRDSAQRCCHRLEAVLEIFVSHLIGKAAELVSSGVDIVGTLVERRRGIVELGHCKVHMLIRGIECLRKLGGHVVKRARTSVNRGVDGVVGGLECFLGITNAALGVLHQLLGRFIDRTRLLEHTARRRQRIGRRAQNARQRRSISLNVLQVPDRIAERRGQVGDKVADLVGAHIIEQAGHRLETDARNGLGKRFVNLVLNGARTLLGHDLGDGVGLLVLVKLDIGVFHVGREKRHHVSAKRFGDNDGSIVRARLNALDSLFAIVKHNPIEALVAA